MNIKIYQKIIFCDFIVELIFFSILIHNVIQETKYHMGRLSSISDGLKYSDNLTIFYTCIICCLLLYKNMYEFAICPYERQWAWRNSKITWGMIVLRTVLINIVYTCALLISSITTVRNGVLHDKLTVLIIAGYITHESVCLVIRVRYYFYGQDLIKNRAAYRLGIVCEVIFITGMILSSMCFVSLVCEDKPNKNIAEYVLFYIPVFSSLFKLMDLVVVVNQPPCVHCRQVSSLIF
jgi:hypothetical protein